MKKINVAILGAGHIAESMSAALAGLKSELNMYAVASRSLERAEAFRERFGFQKAYGTYAEMAADEAIDLVYIATPHSEHFNNAKLCLEAGRNCLVEKAFTANVAQAKELVRLAQAKNVFLAEAMWTRYQPGMSAIKGYIDDGMIGTVTNIEADFAVPISHIDRLTNPALAGGALLDLGVYSLSVPLMLYGKDFADVSAECSKYKTGVDETDRITLKYADGVTAVCKASFVRDNSNYARITGTTGSIEFYTINRPEHVKITDNSGKVLLEKDIPVMVNGYEYEVLAAKEAILNGRTEAEAMPLSESVYVMELMDSIREKFGVKYPFE